MSVEKTVVFEHEKDTKNTHRYQEKSQSDSDVIIGTLYVKKSLFQENMPHGMGKADVPKELTVTIKYTR